MILQENTLEKVSTLKELSLDSYVVNTNISSRSGVKDDYIENFSKRIKVKEYEKQIDQLVYKLYNLTPDEIEIVENSSKK